MKQFINKYFIRVILIVGLILRLINLNQSLWIDEATTALVARMSFPDIFTKFLPGDFHPPLYYLFMKFWVSIFGSAEISLRIPSVIFGVLIIYFIYLIAKKLFDVKTGIIASILASTSGLLIYYSQEARMYSLTAFLATALVYLYLQKKWVLFSVSLILLGMTDYTALLIVPVFLIFNKESRKKVLTSLIPLFLTFVFWMPIFVKQLSEGLALKGSSWWNILGQVSFKNIVLVPVKFILGRIGFDNKTLYALIAVAVCVVFGYLIIKSIKTPKLIWAWLIIPILSGIIISIKIPVLYYFRFLFCLPAFYLLIAGGITKLSGKKYWIFLSFVLLINVASSCLYLFNSKFHRENWRNISIAVGEDTIIYPSNSQTEALTYYQKSRQIVYFGDFDGGPSVVWLSRYVWQIFDPNDTARIRMEYLGYNKTQELNMNGVEFWKYIK